MYTPPAEECMSMYESNVATETQPAERPHEFDDVLGRCLELELMLGRLRRQHLLPEEEYVACERKLASVYGNLTDRQERWALSAPFSR
jgi:hypothetical protein